MNTAGQAVGPSTAASDEPSMEEIMDSIKQIIADDEHDHSKINRRENFTHPSNPSNSNEVEAELEADLQAAMEAEFQRAADELLAENLPAGDDGEGTVHHLIEFAGAANPADDKALPKSGTDEILPPSVGDRIEQLRREVSAATQGLSLEERLEKYRIRGKPQLESFATRQAAEPVKPEPAAPPPIAMPSAHAIAKEMAHTMLVEKGPEVEQLLSDILKPTIRRWLSDNLPSLVEKLVREEIQRASHRKQAS